MGWAADIAPAVIETFHGAFPGAVPLACVAIDPEATVVELDGAPPDGRFEVGSLTKTMTGTLLARLAGEGLVELDENIGRWVAAGPHGEITLRQLATHTSGLPRLAPGQTAGEDNPYAYLTEPVVESALRRAERTPGRDFAYSNFGYQVLGLALARVTGRPYGTILAELVLDPLGMTCSGVDGLGGGQRITGYVDGKPAPHWDMPVPGPGGVETTAEDFGRYLAACLAPPPDALGTAIRLAQIPEARIDEHREIGLGWLIRDDRYVWHNGGTGGFAGSAAIDPAEGRALAILAGTHGTAAHQLDRAVLTALADGDPREARPQTLGPQWEQFDAAGQAGGIRTLPPRSPHTSE
jgi:CubicO group peptidase (beta-lactamase class C family)